MGLRIFVLDQQDQIIRMPVKKFTDWSRGHVAFPEFSRQNVKVAFFFGATENRRLCKIRYAEFTVETVDESGLCKQFVISKADDEPYSPDTEVNYFETLKRRKERISYPQYAQTQGAKLVCYDWVPSQEQVDEFYNQMFSTHKKRTNGLTRNLKNITSQGEAREASSF